MKNRNIPILLSAALLAALTLLASCTRAPFADNYPGAGDVALWDGETVPVDSHWSYIGTQSVSVRGQVRDFNLWTADQVRTMIFVRGGQDAPSILLLSRVVKGPGLERFVYLGGSKTELNGRQYRDAQYALGADTRDPEYRRYFEALRAAGQPLAPNYRARVLDRLPTDQVLVRVMELTPGNATFELPPFADLYPQDRDEPIPRHFY